MKADTKSLLNDYVNGISDLQKKYKKKTIQAFVYPDNIASIRLLEKIGFVYQSHDPKNKRALYQYRHNPSLNIDSKHHFD